MNCYYFFCNTVLFCCPIIIILYRRELLEATYVENEIAFARSQGAFTLSNPLAVVKDEGMYGRL